MARSLPRDAQRSFFCEAEAAFSSRSAPAAARDQYENRLRIVSLGRADSELAPLPLAEDEEKEDRGGEHARVPRGTRLLVFARLPNDGQRSPWTLVAISALAIIDFYNFPCPPLSELLRSTAAEPVPGGWHESALPLSL